MRGKLPLSAHPHAKRTKRLKPISPVKRGQPYGRIWRIVDGAVRDALASHPEYIEERWVKSARFSITKRVTGAMTSYAAQAAKGREAAADKGEPDLPVTPIGRLARAALARGWEAARAEISRWRRRNG